MKKCVLAILLLLTLGCTNKKYYYGDDNRGQGWRRPPHDNVHDRRPGHDHRDNHHGGRWRK